jgi:hypothetical protein
MISRLVWGVFWAVVAAGVVWTLAVAAVVAWLFLVWPWS